MPPPNQKQFVAPPRHPTRSLPDPHGGDSTATSFSPSPCWRRMRAGAAHGSVESREGTISAGIYVSILQQLLFIMTGNSAIELHQNCQWPVTNQSKCPSNTLVVIPIPATPRRAKNSQVVSCHENIGDFSACPDGRPDRNDCRPGAARPV